MEKIGSELAEEKDQFSERSKILLRTEWLYQIWHNTNVDSDAPRFIG
jgi:hypothetical protein